MKGRSRIIYSLAVIVLLFIYTIADRTDTADFECERNALVKIAESPEKIVLLASDCFVMDWRIITDYRLRELDSDLLHYWNVTDEKKYFYQEEQEVLPGKE